MLFTLSVIYGLFSYISFLPRSASGIGLIVAIIVGGCMILSLCSLPVVIGIGLMARFRRFLDKRSSEVISYNDGISIPHIISLIKEFFIRSSEIKTLIYCDSTLWIKNGR